MTRQGAGVLAASLLSLVVGFAADWPEFVMVGALLGAVVLMTLAWSLGAPRGTAAAAQSELEVPRLSPAATDVTIRSRRSRGIVMEDGSETEPRAYHRIGWSGNEGIARLNFDTSRRTVRTHGPFTAVRADLLGLTRRTVAEGSTLHLVVTPRLGEVNDDLRAWNPGDDWEAPRSLRKTHLSEQLREYVIGDEPRRIHWRSTARAGKLIVRERVGTESRDTLVFLDTDPHAWQTGGTFDTDDSLDNFELGVELATSVVHQLVQARVQVAFLHGQIEHAAFVDRVSRSVFDRKMAEVTLQPTLGSAHARLPGALRSHQFRRIIVVTFRPSVELQRVLTSRGKGSVVRLITPMPPSSSDHGFIPVESVRWTPTAP